MANVLSSTTKEVAKSSLKVQIIRTVRHFNPRTNKMEITEKGTLMRFGTVQDALDHLKDVILPRAINKGWKCGLIHSNLYGLGGIVVQKSLINTMEFKIWTPWGI